MRQVAGEPNFMGGPNWQQILLAGASPRWGHHCTTMDVLQPQDAIVSLCQELVACVTKILDPLSAQADRATCNQVGRIVPINEQAKYIKVFGRGIQYS